MLKIYRNTITTHTDNGCGTFRYNKSPDFNWHNSLEGEEHNINKIIIYQCRRDESRLRICLNDKVNLVNNGHAWTQNGIISGNIINLKVDIEIYYKIPYW